MVVSRWIQVQAGLKFRSLTLYICIYYILYIICYVYYTQAYICVYYLHDIYYIVCVCMCVCVCVCVCAYILEIVSSV